MIELRSLDDPTLKKLSQGPEAYAASERLELGDCGEILRDVAVQTAALVEGARETSGLWGGFLAVDQDRRVVGTCAFKGPPDAEGAVEIAYYTFPPYEGQGYATAMAESLCQRAREATEVGTLRAHTLPERNASVCILEKLGFHHVGNVLDPEDGPVWRWERPVRHSFGPA